MKNLSNSLIFAVYFLMNSLADGGMLNCSKPAPALQNVCFSTTALLVAPAETHAGAKLRFFIDMVAVFTDN